MQNSNYYTENLGNNVNLEMVHIPAGKFSMGSTENDLDSASCEFPQHEVTVPEFYMGCYPVTQGQWKAVVKATEKVDRDLDYAPSGFTKKYSKKKRWTRPVEQVSWPDAKEFCARLSQMTGKIYQLPSEAQWEYACRAGTTTPYYCGDTITTYLANYDGSHFGVGSQGKDRKQTTPVDLFPPNAFGLYDMHGNVWEWCEDNWYADYHGAPDDGKPWVTSPKSIKVLRGGSWRLNYRACRSANRYGSYLNRAVYDIGLRIVSIPGSNFKTSTL